MRRALVSSIALSSVLAASAAIAAPRRIDATVELAAQLAGSQTQHPALAGFARRSRPVAVVVELIHPPSSAEIARLEGIGLTFTRGRSGGLLGRNARFAARLAVERAAEVARDPAVKRLGLDGRPFQVPRPLDLTTRMIGADAVHRRRDASGRLITGEGVTVCDVDSGIDVMHPMFFRADGGLSGWNDENANGILDPGIDTVEHGGERVVLRALNGIVSRYSGDTVLLGSELPQLDLRFDYLYADINGDDVRNVGTKFGFGEDSPSLGEPLYVADDVDDSGSVERGEKLAALGSSKIRAFRVGDEVYRRGESLLQAPWKQEFQHGNGASGVMVGGQLGYGHLVGLAPDADLIVATDPDGGREFAMTSFCMDEGARVVLHEYAPWITFHLDGSSDLEQLIDASVEEGVAHVNPAGNLSGSQKQYLRALPAGSTTRVAIDVPDIGSAFMISTFLWREPSRPLSFVVTAPSGSALPLDLAPGADGQFAGELDGFDVMASVDMSARGTAKLDLYVYPSQVVIPLPIGSWSLDVTDGSPPGGAPLTLIGFVFDEVSGWGKGTHFPEHASEQHLIGWPATADRGLAVAAYTGHDFDDGVSGQRAPYSGRGHRIDGERLLWISAPDNPVVPGRFADRALSYLVYGGTSGASPHVAGAAALMLAHDPSLDGREVKARIAGSAVADRFTGAAPNDDFGFGKLDAHGAIFGVPAPGGEAPVVQPASLTVAIGATEVAFQVSDADDHAIDLVLEVDRDYDGVFDEVLPAPMLPLAYGEPGEHVLKVRATDPSGRAGQALLRVTVRPADDEDDGDGGASSDGYGLGGGGCTVRGVENFRGSRRGLGLALAVGALAIVRRRSSRCVTAAARRSRT